MFQRLEADAEVAAQRSPVRRLSLYFLTSGPATLGRHTDHRPTVANPGTLVSKPWTTASATSIPVRLRRWHRSSQTRRTAAPVATVSAFCTTASESVSWPGWLETDVD